MQEILRAEGLDKSYRLSAKQMKLQNAKTRDVHAVDNLSFSVNRGEIFGLLGPNGAGKTTTLRMLATLVKPDAGNAYIDGAGICESPSQVRAKIGFLTSELKLEEFFSPDFLFDYFARLHNVPEDVCRQRKGQLFKTFGINRFAGVKVSNLSTGMKQKASLAISVVHDPEIIIFDEPTNGLDVITAKIVTDFLFELRERGKTIILSTHIFTLAEKLCDRVGVIINGKMADCGTLEQVTRGKSLEDRFFDIYTEVAGGDE